MPPTKRHKNFATWAGAVKDWNMNQAFKDELYGIPKKGSSFYDEVFELFYGKPVETPAPVAPAVVVALDTAHRPVVVVFVVVEPDIAGKPAVEQAVAGIDNTPAVVLDIDNIVVVRYKLSNQNPWWLLFTIFTKFWLTTVVFMLQ